MNKIIKEEILELTQECIKIFGDKIVEENTEIILEMMVMIQVEIETVLEKDQFLETLVTEEMIGVQVIVGPDKDQGQVQTETESGVTNVGNMIISQRSVLHLGRKGN